jgi:exopolysaccharide production protein ExoY
MESKYYLYEEDGIVEAKISVDSHSEVTADKQTCKTPPVIDSSYSGFSRLVKRALDLLGVLLVSSLLLPLLLVVAILVKLTSSGPVFFSHRRICRDGEFFSMLKFRTMYVDSSDVLQQYFSLHPEALSEWQTTHKLRCDPRVTPLGRVLRRLSLDELPQFWNVIKGQMSLVGPRPIVAA